MEGYSPEPGEIIEEINKIVKKKTEYDYNKHSKRHAYIHKKKRRSHSKSSSYKHSRRRYNKRRDDNDNDNNHRKRERDYSSISSYTSKQQSGLNSITSKGSIIKSTMILEQELHLIDNNNHYNNEHSTINIHENKQLLINDNHNNINQTHNKEDRRKRIKAIQQKHQFNSNKTIIMSSPQENQDIESEEILKKKQEEQESFIKYINHERELLTKENIKNNRFPLDTTAINNDNNNNTIESPVTPDMFADDPIIPLKTINPNNLNATNNNNNSNNQAINLSFFNQTESIGYYIPQMNEIIISKYKVIGLCGKGIFSSVVKVFDINNHIEYALKIIRDINIMKASGDKERSIISQLNKEDHEDKSHIIRLRDTFEFNNHLCMIFDLYHMNLRDMIKNLNAETGGGIPMNQLKSFTQQLIQGFILIHRNRLIHADFKPDNTIINTGGDHLRICDFGSAFYEDEAIITSELVSRYYRAPEIILGLKPNQKIDIWSLGCTIYELYTGTILFPGKSNNEMIKLFVQTKGKVSKKLIRRCLYGSEYFSIDGNYFKSKEFDSKLNCDAIKDVDINQLKQKDILELLKESKRGKNESDIKSLGNLANLLGCCLAIDPFKRISAIDAFTHPFLIIT